MSKSEPKFKIVQERLLVGRKSESTCNVGLAGAGACVVEIAHDGTRARVLLTPEEATQPGVTLIASSAKAQELAAELAGKSALGALRLVPPTT